MNKKISVAIATYNGEKYIAEQLKSINEQTTPPDEIVIYDDCSTDNTVSIIKSIKQNLRFELILIQGSPNIGVNKAFEKSIENCRGSYVLFSDQDDIWKNNKIEIIVSTFEKNPDISYVFSNSDLVDSSGQHLNKSLWDAVGFDARKQKNYEINPVRTILTKGAFIYGMSMAFRLEVLKKFIPINVEWKNMTHDTWFSLLATSSGFKGAIIKENLVNYRKHSKQTTALLANKSGEKNKLNKEISNSKIKSNIEALQKVKIALNKNSTSNFQQLNSSIFEIDAKISFLEKRLNQRSVKSLKNLLLSIFDKSYWRFASGPMSALRDFL